MKIRLFGKDLFEFHGKAGDLYAQPAYNSIKESKYLPDFKTMADGGNSWDGVIQISNMAFTQDVRTPNNAISNVKIVDAPKKPKKELTPKKVYSLQMLHEKEFKINMEPDYIDKQVAAFKEKLTLIKSEEYDMRCGTQEIASILVRMENRKKYDLAKETLEKFPYTTNTRITSVIKKHDYLQLGQVAQFLADMPKEATDAMKEYNKACAALCGKQAVFYIIANKKDFQKSQQRRDPILLAQSPIGHFWQILGAWDDEMLFLDEL